MGFGKPGGSLLAHLKEIKSATRLHLEKLDEGVPADQVPPAPEAYRLLVTLRSTGTSYWSGGWASQPYLLTLEIEAAATAEGEEMERRAFNERQRREWERRLAEMNRQAQA